MDDIIRTGIAIIIVTCAAGAVLLYGIARLLVLALHALETGDTSFILASSGIVLLLCAGYVGTGLWLRRTGRI
jgi:hypothetical protein